MSEDGLEPKQPHERNITTEEALEKLVEEREEEIVTGEDQDLPPIQVGGLNSMRRKRRCLV